MNGFFASIPRVLDEAVALDGLNRMQILFRIHLPLLRPGIMTIVIYSLISSWTEFTFASILVSSDSKRSLTIVPEGDHELPIRFSGDRLLRQRPWR